MFVICFKVELFGYRILIFGFVGYYRFRYVVVLIFLFLVRISSDFGINGRYFFGFRVVI